MCSWLYLETLLEHEVWARKGSFLPNLFTSLRIVHDVSFLFCRSLTRIQESEHSIFPAPSQGRASEKGWGGRVGGGSGLLPFSGRHVSLCITVPFSTPTWLQYVPSIRIKMIFITHEALPTYTLNEIIIFQTTALRGLVHSISYNPHDDPVKYVLLVVSLFYMWARQG